MAQIDKIQVGSTTYDIAASSNSTNTFTSSDVADGSATAWTTVAALASGETSTSIFAKISQMFKNIRFLYSRLGTTDISGVGSTVTAAISALNSGKAAATHSHSAFTSAAAGFVPAAASGSTSYLTSGYVLTGAGWKAGTKYNTDTNTTYANYVGATTAASGTAGLVPAATTATRTRFLRGDGTWQVPTNTTYAVATTAANGLMSSADKTKIDKTLIYGDNTYQNTQVGIISNVGYNSNSWTAASLKVMAEYGNDNNVRAGIGFENQTNYGAYLFLRPSGANTRFMIVDSSGNLYAIMDSGAFNLQGSTLYITTT